MKIDRKGMIIGTLLGILLTLVTVSATNMLSLNFSATIIVPEGLNIEVSGLSESNGIYTLSFPALDDDNTYTSFEIYNSGSGDVSVSYSATIDSSLGLMILIDGDSVSAGYGHIQIPDGESFTIARGSMERIRVSIYDLGASAGSYSLDLTFVVQEV